MGGAGIVAASCSPHQGDVIDDAGDLLESLSNKSLPDFGKAAPLAVRNKILWHAVKNGRQRKRLCRAARPFRSCRHHIIVSAQRPAGDLLRRVSALASSLSAEEMQNRIEFLGTW